MHSPCSTASRLHRATSGNARFSFSRGPAEHKKCGSRCSMFMLPTPAPVVTLLCTSCMPPVRARVFRGPPSASASSTTVKRRRPSAQHNRRHRNSTQHLTASLPSTTVPRKVPHPSTRRPRVRQATDPPATHMMLPALPRKYAARSKEAAHNKGNCAHGTRRSS